MTDQLLEKLDRIGRGRVSVFAAEANPIDYLDAAARIRNQAARIADLESLLAEANAEVERLRAANGRLAAQRDAAAVASENTRTALAEVARAAPLVASVRAPTIVRVWYAASDEVERMGPFSSDVDAWAALRLSPTAGRIAGRVHPPGAYVWPEAGG